MARLGHHPSGSPSSDLQGSLGPEPGNSEQLQVGEALEGRRAACCWEVSGGSAVQSLGRSVPGHGFPFPEKAGTLWSVRKLVDVFICSQEAEGTTSVSSLMSKEEDSTTR